RLAARRARRGREPLVGGGPSPAPRSPARASAPAPAGIESSWPSCFLSIGASRPPPPGAARKMPSTRWRARSMSLMTRPVWRVGSAFSPLSATRREAGSAAPAVSLGPRPRRKRPRVVGRGAGAVLGLVPLGGKRDQLAIGIARGDVGDHNRGQGPGVMQLLAAALDAAFVGELAQHALERGAVGVLQAEGAGDLAGADLAG